MAALPRHPRASGRKRPRRIQKKIDKRYGALHFRDAAHHYILQVSAASMAALLGAAADGRVIL